MAPTSASPRDMLIGGILQSLEAITLGMPCEVWKTRQGAFPHEGVVESMQNILKEGGPAALWRGSSAKMLESFLKGGVLLYAKETLLSSSEAVGLDRKSGFTSALAGAGGGIAQTVVMSPLTYVITFKVKNPDKRDWGTFKVLQSSGIRAAYGSAIPMAGRQASNWALRQAIADTLVKKATKAKGQKLSVPERMVCGLLGGSAACINQPIEVMRITVQARHATGDAAANTTNSARMVFQKHGWRGFYAGVGPRFLLSAWQTLFMVTFADMVKEHLDGPKKE
jgi:hypothetical protein